jgi:hypothetical protein
MSKSTNNTELVKVLEEMPWTIQVRRSPFSVRAPKRNLSQGSFVSLDFEDLERNAENSETPYADQDHENAAILERLFSDRGYRGEAFERFEDDLMTTLPLMNAAAAYDDLALKLLGNKAMKYCEQLSIFAEKGSQCAANELAAIAEAATRWLGTVAKRNPELLRSFAATRAAFPALVSECDAFRGDKLDWKQLTLGNKFPIKLRKKAKFRVNDATGKIAWPLLLYVVDIKMDATKSADRQGITWQEIENKTTKTIEDLAFLLPDLTRESLAIKKWWEVAKSCLLEAYPDPESIPELRAMVTAKSQQKCIASRVLEKLENKFYSFAGFLEETELGNVARTSSIQPGIQGKVD